MYSITHPIKPGKAMLKLQMSLKEGSTGHHNAHQPTFLRCLTFLQETSMYITGELILFHPTYFKLAFFLCYASNIFFAKKNAY